MFVEKVTAGAAVGAILGVIGGVLQVVDGGPFLDGLRAIPAGAILGVLGGIWWWWRGDAGEDYTSYADPQIMKLQNRLRSTLDAAAGFESRGDYSNAAALRSQAAVIEAQLRNHGS